MFGNPQMDFPVRILLVELSFLKKSLLIKDVANCWFLFISLVDSDIYIGILGFFSELV
jgi:hypothetical protein